MARKKKIPRNDLGIPEYEMEALAKMLLPILKKYIDSDEGKKDWKKWGHSKENANKIEISDKEG